MFGCSHLEKGTSESYKWVKLGYGAAGGGGAGMISVTAQLRVLYPNPSLHAAPYSVKVNNLTVVLELRQMKAFYQLKFRDKELAYSSEKLTLGRVDAKKQRDNFLALTSQKSISRSHAAM